jgi:hypothetical protein
VQRLAAVALGDEGSVAAVEALLPLARGFIPSSVREAARGAIASIQARLVHAEAGSLSLVVDQELAGAVAIAKQASAHAGAVSLVESEMLEPGVSREHEVGEEEGEERGFRR